MKGLLKQLVDRVFPKMPDFFRLLSEQCNEVEVTVGHLVEFMETRSPEVGEKVRQDEHTADTIKAHNLHTLNEAFSTPIDREDIYRAITDLDDIVVYCKTTVSEMHVLGVEPDAYTLGLARQIQEGVHALVSGFAKLGKEPHAAEEDAAAARQADRHAEKLYRQALAELFQGEDYLNMLKRREIYRHLANASHHMAKAGNTLHDIVVKMT